LTPRFDVLQFLQRLIAQGDLHEAAGLHVLRDEAVAIVLRQ
jgi:hypothetical protein